jgi:SPP1 family phage portal protein
METKNNNLTEDTELLKSIYESLTSRKYHGRKRAYSSYEPEELNKNTVKEILTDCLPIFNSNKTETRYLNDVYTGLQDIRFKTKEVREEINNRTTENNAYSFVEFKKGFVFGKPIQYVQRNKKNAKEVSTLNDYFVGQNKASKDTELAEDLYISGRAFRYIAPAKPIEEYDAPFEMHNLDKDRCEVVYNSGIGHKQLLGFVETPFSKRVLEDGTEIPEYNIYSVYTYDKYYEYKGTIGSSLTFVREESLNIKGHRILEYYLNKSRLGIIEVVLDLLNQINLLESNDMDSVVQFVNSFLILINANIDIDDYKAFKREGAILLKSDEKRVADAKLLADKLSHADTQVFYDRMFNACLRILGIPSMQDSVQNGSTGQANLVGQGWTMADQRANQDEEEFKKTDYILLNQVLKICKKFDNEHIKKLTIRDIDIKFTRNKSDNLLTKTQGLLNLKSAQVDPQTAFATVELFPDPNEACTSSEKYYENFWSAQVMGNNGFNGNKLEQNNDVVDTKNDNEKDKSKIAKGKTEKSQEVNLQKEINAQDKKSREERKNNNK